MVFGGGILGGARKIWGNPYLNSTTVLFDMIILILNLMALIPNFTATHATTQLVLISQQIQLLHIKRCTA